MQLTHDHIVYTTLWGLIDHKRNCMEFIPLALPTKMKNEGDLVFGTIGFSGGRHF